ncbi:hypothetical protein NUW54_g631 [Trametes sanguinea]|uniref:Uncharacterized protein n=1 Tax=Trametes sanguinea TaxID=158606 RepID=A0ACC1QAH7_9APHY|nr:hypothetical protein NUW54_g631 [Trametes sanguinea]
MSTLCPGCLRSFTKTGLNIHLGKTTNASCSAIYAAMRNVLPSDSSSGDEDDSVPPGQENPPPVADPEEPHDLDNADGPDSLAEGPVPFPGDFFGQDYAPADFGFQEDGGDIEMQDPSPDDDFDVTMGINTEDDSDGSSDSDDEDDHDRWEPPPPPTATAGTDSEQDDVDGSSHGDYDAGLDPGHDSPSLSNPATRQEAEEHLRRVASIERFPGTTAGAPVQQASRTNIYEDYLQAVAGAENPYAPFPSFMNWAIARWAKLRGPGSTALTELLGIPGLPEALQLSFKTANELNAIIDKHLPGRRPRFQREDVIVADEAFDVYFRDIIECIRALFGDAEFAQHLVFAPEQGTRAAKARGNHHSPDNLVGQDPGHPLPWQDSLPRVPHDWQHSERAASQALSMRASSPRIPSNVALGTYHEQGGATSNTRQPMYTPSGRTLGACSTSHSFALPLSFAPAAIAWMSADSVATPWQKRTLGLQGVYPMELALGASYHDTTADMASSSMRSPTRCAQRSVGCAGGCRTKSETP